MYQNYNANPVRRRAEDCAVRAISKALNKSWDEVYCALCQYGRYNYDMPTSNYVWGEYLKDQGWTRHIIPCEISGCYTIKRFANEYNVGSYVIAVKNHAVAVCNGDWYDSWDSGDEVVLYYWQKGD